MAGRCHQVPDVAGRAGSRPAAGAAHPRLLRSAGQRPGGQPTWQRAQKRGGACACSPPAGLRSGLVRAPVDLVTSHAVTFRRTARP